MKTKLLSGALLVTGLGLTGIGVTSVQAACLQTEQIVERVLTYSAAYGAGASYIYLRPRTALTNTVYYYCRITQAEPSGNKMISEAASAKSNRVEVNVQGNAAACPAAGAGRFMGDCDYVYMLN